MVKLPNLDGLEKAKKLLNEIYEKEPSEELLSVLESMEVLVDCKCYEIENYIEENVEGSWNCGGKCEAWNKMSEELEDNNIEFPPHSDEAYGCTCPTCGRMVCGWCV